MWTWIATGLGSFAAVSVVLGLALARILQRISRELSELHPEQWQNKEAAL